MESKPIEAKTEERLPWHKPEVVRLVINLDTQDETGAPVPKVGSHVDASGFGPFFDSIT